MQNTLVKVGSKDFNTISQPATVLRHWLIFVEFAEELTQKSQYSFHWRHGHRKVQFFNRAEKTSSAHTAPKMSVGTASKSTANEGNLSLITTRISGYASVVVLLEGDLLLYQSGAPPTVKNLRPPLPRQLHSFFFVFEHTLILMLCHQ